MDTLSKKKYKLAIIAPTPFYYHVPLYQKLTESSEIDLMVYYCSDETLLGSDVEKTYNTKGSFMGKEYFLERYNYKFLKNYSPTPSYLKWPFGLINLEVWREIKKGKYDAVVLQSWTNLTWWLAFFACLKFKTPVLFMTDANVVAETTKSKIKIYVKKKMLSGFLFKEADGFLTSGTANEQFYIYYGVPAKKMVRFYFSWGYEKLIYKALQLKSKKDDIRKSFGVNKDDFLVLFVGRLAKEKNIEVLLNAFANVRAKNKKLFLVGDGPLRGDIEQSIKDLKTNDIFVMGFQSRESMLNFYTAADLLVLPSNAETWGIVVNEAMCFGLPVVVSNKVGAAADLVRDGYNGFIFPPDDKERLSTCIEKLINLTMAEREIFGSRSFEIIDQWLKSIDQKEQIKKILGIIKSQSN